MRHPPAATLAQRLSHVIETMHPAGRGPWTNEEIAQMCQKRGFTCSTTYLWQLRTGRRDNPTMRHLEGLAAVLGVPPAYFFDQSVTDRVDAELETLAALRDSSVRQIAQRAIDLSPAGRASIAALIDNALALERSARHSPTPAEPPAAENTNTAQTATEPPPTRKRRRR